MRIALPLFLALSLASPALALEPMPADGEWMCDVRDVILRIEIEGETYRYTNPVLPGGDLALYLDGVTYDVVSGPLRDRMQVTQIKYDKDLGEESLVLSTGDLDALTWIAACFRIEQ